MYIENVQFNSNSSVSYEAFSLSKYHLHCHKEAIEILYVLKGIANVRVVFEDFLLKEGDYIVIDRGDSHFINSVNGECYIVSLYINLNQYRNKYPFIDYVWFTCESFDLVHYKNQVHLLSKMILEIIRNLMSEENETIEKVSEITDRLVEILVKKYNICNYYNRNANISNLKMEKYYTIMRYIYEHYEMDHLIDYISQQEHYSKSYITHLFKEVGAISFQDILTYERISHSLELLLTTRDSINDISEKCGFSYVKYYTRDFKKWFLCTPSQYRNQYHQALNKEDILFPLAKDEVLQLIMDIGKNLDDTEYRISINPFSLKLMANSKEENFTNNVGTPSSFKYWGYEKGLHQQVYIRIKDTNKISRCNLICGISSFEEAGYDPVIGIYLQDLLVTGCRETMNEIIELVGHEKAKNMKYFIIYKDLADGPSAVRIADEGKKIFGTNQVEVTLMV